MVKIKNIISIVCVGALACSLAACGPSVEKVFDSNTDESVGVVTEINSTQATTKYLSFYERNSYTTLASNVSSETFSQTNNKTQKTTAIKAVPSPAASIRTKATINPTTKATTEATTNKVVNKIVPDGSFPAYNSNKSNFQIGDVTGKRGTTVKVPVSLNNNPGVWGFNLNIAYDKECFSCESASNGTVFSNSEIMFGLPNSNPYIISACYTSLVSDNMANGVIAYLNFKIANDAPKGTYNLIYSKYCASDFCNAATKDVPFTFKAGTITVV